MKRKSAARLQSELWNQLRPEMDSATLITEITELLHKLLGKSTRNVNVAHNLATYLLGRYSVSQRKKGALNWLIARHANDLKEFLSANSIKDLLSFLKTGDSFRSQRKSPEANHKRRLSEHNAKEDQKTDTSPAGAITAAA